MIENCLCFKGPIVAPNPHILTRLFLLRTREGCCNPPIDFPYIESYDAYNAVLGLCPFNPYQPT